LINSSQKKIRILFCEVFASKKKNFSAIFKSKRESRGLILEVFLCILGCLGDKAPLTLRPFLPRQMPNNDWPEDVAALCSLFIEL
jgi:hypothetical protein